MKPTTALFLLAIFGLPLVQAGIELARDGKVQALEIVGPVEEARLRKFEDDLREASLVHEHVTPWYQGALTRVLGRGNEKAVLGEDETVHLAADLEAITARPYLRDAGGPVDAIVDFRDQLAERGVELVVLPTPEKTAVMPRTLSKRIRAEQTPHPDDAELLRRLEAAGVHVIDLFAFYRELPQPLYLARDTHWTPDTMERVAAETARRIRELVDVPATRSWRTEPVPMWSSGDLLGMLRYPKLRDPYLLMQVEPHRVVDAETGAPCATDESAPVLVLGDSFTRVFSDAELGFSSAAGFAEHLAKELSSDVDVIAVAGGASRTVRENLARRPQGVSGKRVVVWQFAMRDLPVESNRWERVPLGEIREPGPAPLAAGALDVTAEITEVTRVTNFEYAFGLAVYEYRVVTVHAGATDEETLWVAHVVVDDFKATEAANFRVGDVQRLVLEPIENHYDLESTSWADDTDAGFEIWFAVERKE